MVLKKIKNELILKKSQVISETTPAETAFLQFSQI